MKLVLDKENHAKGEYHVWACLVETDQPWGETETFIIGSGKDSNEAIKEAAKTLQDGLKQLEKL